MLAESALAILARKGEAAEECVWQFETQFQTRTPEGMKFVIRLSGSRLSTPGVPATVPAHTVFPADIPKDPGWRGTYRLTVAAPVLAFDICWRPEEPLRIMTFSRGDWEAQLASLAL